MYYQPSAAELAEFPEMPAKERIYYFLSRTIECEEVWGHADTEGWVMREEGGKSILPVWSYQSLADACIDDTGLSAQAVSLEHFIDILGRSRESIYLEILPMPNQSGALIDAVELLSMFESLMDSGTYFLEG